MKFAVKNCHTGKVQFTAEVECDVAAPLSMKLGLVVRWAIMSGADLSGANLSYADLSGADLSGADLSGANLLDADLSGADLSGANLSGANLTGADLSRADLSGANLSGANLSYANLSGANLSYADLSKVPLIDGGLRSDGHRFWLTAFLKEGLRIKAGCRNFTLEQARQHWRDTRAGTQLGVESMLMLDYLERMAEVRGWKARPDLKK